MIFIIGVAFSLFAFSSLFLSHIFIEDSEKQTQTNVQYWTQYIANLSVRYLDDSQPDSPIKKAALYDSIAQLAPLDLIKVVDIYRYNPDEKTEQFHLSYRHQNPFDLKSNYPIFQLLSAEKQRLSTPHITENYAEYFMPIQQSDKVLGYIYVQMNSYSGLFQNGQLILVLAVIFIIVLAGLWLIMYRLESFIVTPLFNMATDIQYIAKTKNYTSKIDVMPYQEIDMLAKNINILLSRTEKHMAKLQLAEQQGIERTQELEAKIINRTTALKESNHELLSTLEKLHQFQDQLVESGKMASLGDMVAGVAHEVNTPIGLGVTASTLLSDRLLEMKRHFEDKTLKSSQLKRFFDEGQENVGIIYRNLKRAAELISSFKKVAVDQSTEDIRQFSMTELIEEVLLTLAPQIRVTPYKVEFDCPDDLLVVSKPGPINQILINLILNSILHAFENRETGTIAIAVSSLDDTININFKDDGNGIDKAMINKIFEPFTTTKRGSGGSGLGLHLVYNLVTQALGGTIKIESSSGKGTEFTIIFPQNLDHNFT
ncbi:ATP-binding protein [Thalassotalea piscium]